MNVTEFDEATLAWIKGRPYTETTVMQCEECHLWYKPSLGHKCKKKTRKDEKEMMSMTMTTLTEIKRRLQSAERHYCIGDMGGVKKELGGIIREIKEFEKIFGEVRNEQ